MPKLEARLQQALLFSEDFVQILSGLNRRKFYSAVEVRSACGNLPARGDPHLMGPMRD
jgi:hypothetical protein